MRKRKIRQALSLISLNTVFLALCFITLVPVLYAFLLSVSDGSSAFAGGVGPRSFTLENYRRIITEEPFLGWKRAARTLK